jgi:SAM-dependent methyltransferase
LLDFCRAAADELEVLDCCRFVHAPADDLGGVQDASVDIVTTRSVLIYVEDKHAALREFSRVLASGGRMSLFEPINRFARTPGEKWMGYDLTEVAEVARKVRAVYEAIQPPDSDPMLDFDERDLLVLAERAGFFPVRMQLEAEVRRSEPLPWDTFVRTPGNPRIPSFAEAMDRALTVDERKRLEAHLRPLVEEGRGVSRNAHAFLVGIKPNSA